MTPVHFMLRCVQLHNLINCQTLPLALAQQPPGAVRLAISLAAAGARNASPAAPRRLGRPARSAAILPLRPRQGPQSVRAVSAAVKSPLAAAAAAAAAGSLSPMRHAPPVVSVSLLQLASDASAKHQAQTACWTVVHPHSLFFFAVRLALKGSIGGAAAARQASGACINPSSSGDVVLSMTQQVRTSSLSRAQGSLQRPAAPMYLPLCIDFGRPTRNLHC